jgi:hypothetical protein
MISIKNCSKFPKKWDIVFSKRMKKAGFEIKNGNSVMPNAYLLDKIGTVDYQIIAYEGIKLPNPFPEVPIKVHLFPQLYWSGYSLYESSYSHGLLEGGKPFIHYFGSSYGDFCNGGNQISILANAKKMFEGKYKTKFPVQVKNYSKFISMIKNPDIGEYYADVVREYQKHMIKIIVKINKREAALHTPRPPKLPSLEELDKIIDGLAWKDKKPFWWKSLAPQTKGARTL